MYIHKKLFLVLYSHVLKNKETAIYLTSKKMWWSYDMVLINDA